MELEIVDLIMLFAGFLAGVVTFELSCRAVGFYCDSRAIKSNLRNRKSSGES